MDTLTNYQTNFGPVKPQPLRGRYLQRTLKERDAPFTGADLYRGSKISRGAEPRASRVHCRLRRERRLAGVTTLEFPQGSHRRHDASRRAAPRKAEITATGAGRIRRRAGSQFRARRRHPACARCRVRGPSLSSTSGCIDRSWVSTMSSCSRSSRRFAVCSLSSVARRLASRLTKSPPISFLKPRNGRSSPWRKKPKERAVIERSADCICAAAVSVRRAARCRSF